MLLSHPNVTPFHGVMEGLGPLSAMVSHYCSKGHISQYILDNAQEDRLELVSVFQSFPKALSHTIHFKILGVASGLAYLHSMDVIHGDLKGVSHSSVRYQSRSDVLLCALCE